MGRAPSAPRGQVRTSRPTVVTVTPAQAVALSRSWNTAQPSTAASGRELCCMAVPTAKPARRMATSMLEVASTCVAAPVRAKPK